MSERKTKPAKADELYERADALFDEASGRDALLAFLVRPFAPGRRGR